MIKSLHGPALVIAPHPDDETIGAGTLISRLVRGRITVNVVIVTDGAASHAASPLWPKSRLVAARKRESRRALLRQGVTAGRVRFLGLADGSLSGQPKSCGRAVRQVVARYRHLGLIVGPADTDAHPDHRAIARVLVGCRSPARRLSYQVWPHDQRGGRSIRTVSATSSSVKRSLLKLYRTQLGVIHDDPCGFAIARHELNNFCHPIEQFVEVR